MLDLILVAMMAATLPKAPPVETVLPKAPPIVSNDAEGAPTPLVEVARVLMLLPKPAIGFVDYGCGADARWCIAAAERWGCKATGVEINSARAAAAKERVRLSGMSHLVTIIEGDAITTEVQADVGVAYLWPEVLEKLRPRLVNLKAFASYQHQPPGLSVTKNGDTFFYVKPKPVVAATWGNTTYSGPVCNSPNCAMCNAIRRNLPSAAVGDAPVQSGQWVKYCDGRRCWYEWVPNP